MNWNRYLRMVKFAALALLIACLGASLANAQNVSWVVKFDPTKGQFPESIVIDTQGNMYVSWAFIHTVAKVAPDGSVSAFAVLPAGAVLGVTIDPAGNVYALLNFASLSDKGVWRISPDGTSVLFAGIPSAGFLNAMDFGEDGNLYVSDSFKSTIYRVTKDGSVSVWVTDPLLAGVATGPCGTFPPGPFGANGVAFNHEGDLTVLNTTQGSIVRIPVNEDGSPGTPQLFVGPTCDLWGADGQAFDENGTMYVAVNIQGKIVRVNQDATYQTIASAANGDPLFFPTAVAFRPKSEDLHEIFITNFDPPFPFILPGGTPGIVKMNVGNDEDHQE